MNRRDILIGIVVLAVLGGFLYYYQNRPAEETDMVVPETLSVQDELERKFGMDIPDDFERVELKDVSGGDSSGLATRKYEDGLFEHAVLADLPEPETGTFYEGWLVVSGDILSTGKFTEGKGGYMLEYTSNTDLIDHNQVVVTLEKVDDQLPEVHVLEGSF
jgi:hypothetical protein